jgi:hypothetical protein
MLKVKLGGGKVMTPQMVGLAKAAEQTIITGEKNIAALYDVTAPKSAAARRREGAMDKSVKLNDKPAGTQADVNKPTIRVPRIPFDKNKAIPVTGMAGVAYKIIEHNPESGKRTVYFYNKDGAAIGVSE